MVVPPSLLSVYDLIRTNWGDRLPTVHCAQATLIHLAHTLEDLVLSRHIPALIFVGIPEPGYWQQELKRYQALAQAAQQVYIFTAEPLPPESEAASLHVTLSQSDPLRREWFLAILSEPMAVILCGQASQPPAAGESTGQFETVWSFEREAINPVLDLLAGVIAAACPDRLVSLQAARTSYPLTNPDAAIVSYFSMELLRFEEQLRQSLRPTNAVGEQVAALIPAVSEHKQADLHLKRDRQVRLELIDSIEGIVWEADARTFEFLFVSSQAERLLGYPLERWLQERDFWQTHIYQPDREWALNFCLLSTQELKDHEFEYRMVAADGRLVWLRDIVTVVVEDRQAVKLRGLMVDITAQKQSASVLASQNQILEMIAKGRPLADILAAITQSIEEQTPNMLCSILLFNKNEQTLHHGAAPNLPASYSQAIDGMPIGPAAGSCGTAAYREEAVIVTDIATDPLWASYRELALTHGLRACWSTPISSSDKQVLGTFAIYYREPRHPAPRDLQLIQMATNLAGIAIERTQAEKALLESRERFDAFMNHSPILAFIKDEEGRYIYGNRAWINQFNEPAEQLWGKTDFDLWPAEVAQHFRSSDLIALANGQDVAPLMVHTQGGDPLRYWTVFKFILKDIAERQLVGGMALDITERKQLEEQLRQAQKMEAIGRLAGGVAHDFNNLLTVINGYSDLLLQQLSHDNSTRPDLEQIRKAGERAATLTRQLLAFSRQQLLQPQLLNFNEVVTDLEKMLLRLIGEHIELVTQLQPGLGLIKADRGQLEQMVMNLVLNARDAMPQGGRLIIETINVNLDQGYTHHHPDVRPGSYVLLAVGDTGRGIDAATISHIFEPFLPPKRSGRAPV
ncbi:MAG: PAS domain S-box protein [Anaerolineales bacterium]|nr:PAS domain S-box protein [Anaerolineales bacterium]